MYLTKREAALLGGLKKALDLGRLNPKAPTFTARSAALAVASILEQNVTDREVVPLLDQMGVFQRGTGRDPYQRSMTDLLKELPTALECAKVATDEVRDSGKAASAFSERPLKFSWAEGSLIEAINRSIEAGRIRPEAESFSTRQLTTAVCTEIGGKVAERDIGFLLDYLGVFQRGTGSAPYLRSVSELIAVLPHAVAEAGRMKEAELEDLVVTGMPIMLPTSLPRRDVVTKDNSRLNPDNYQSK